MSEIETATDVAPIRPEEEWANALTHGFAALTTLVIGWKLVVDARQIDPGLAVACAAYIASAFGTFLFSTLSHVFLRQPLLNHLRAWDQAMIYAMISGTYTPIIYRFASDDIRVPLLYAIWLAAFSGIAAKLLLRHRINNITTVTYLLLGWLPSIPIYAQVPRSLGLGMLLGGVLYTLGVAVLINDHKKKYMHALWHTLVMSAAFCHYVAIAWYVVSVD